MIQINTVRTSSRLEIILLCFMSFSCSNIDSTEEFQFMRPDSDLLQVKLDNKSIQWVRLDQTDVLMDTTMDSKLYFVFDTKGNLKYDRWCFDLETPTTTAISSVIASNTEDQFAYINGFHGGDSIKEGEKDGFSIRNLNNNCVFFGTVFNNGDGDYDLCLDYYYPESKVKLPDELIPGE